MAGLATYAVLLREPGQPNAEAVRRAFGGFHHLTAMDCVRLAAQAQGILRRHLSADEARALQQALQDQGVAAAVVHEAELRFFPASQRLHRLVLHPATLGYADLTQHQHTVAWNSFRMIAVGAVPHLEVQARADFRLPPQAERQLILELVTAPPVQRFELVGQQFAFADLPACPAGAPGEKFVWLVGELLRRCPGAQLNRGAQDLRDGIQLVRGYSSRQALLDEMVWLWWSGAHRAGPGGGADLRLAG